MKKIIRKIAFTLSFTMFVSSFGMISNVYALDELSEEVYHTEQYQDYQVDDLILTDKEIEMANLYIQEQIDLGNKVRQKRSAIGYVGSLFIPGVGTAVITATGVVIVSGVAIASGSWLYKKVTNYVKTETINRYNSGKRNGYAALIHSTQYGGSLPVKGKPNSSKDLRDSSGLKQRRYYDKNGNAELDIDYRHGGNGKEPFPHKHKWTNGKRGKWFK